MREFEGVRLRLAESAAIWVKLEVLIQPISKFWKLKKNKKIFFRRFFEGSLVNFGAQIVRKRAAFFSAVLWRFSSKIPRPV